MEKKDTLHDMRDWRGRQIVPGVSVGPFRSSNSIGLQDGTFEGRPVGRLERGAPGLVVSLIDVERFRGVCASIMALVLLPNGRQGWATAFELEVLH